MDNHQEFVRDRPNHLNSHLHKPHLRTTMPSYSSRDVGDPSQVKKNKQSMADLKLRRLTELNSRLREDLDRERIPVSAASKRYGRLPLGSCARLWANCAQIASFHTRTARKISWYHLRGALLIRRYFSHRTSFRGAQLTIHQRMIHMRRNNREDAAR